MRIKINVTKEILERSMFCEAPGTVIDGKIVKAGSNCAVALAVRELFPDAYVGYGSIWPFPEENSDILVPDDMYVFINRFDDLSKNPEARLALPEQVFEIDVPEKVIERIGLKELETILSKSVNLELVDR